MSQAPAEGDQLLTREDLAARKLHVEVGYLYKHLRRMQREHGFPAEVLPGKWSERAVDYWIWCRSWNLQLRPEGQSAASEPCSPYDDEAETDRRLARNAAGLAAAGISRA